MFGIIATRGPDSPFGYQQYWAKLDGRIARFKTEEVAKAIAREWQRQAIGPVSYAVAPYPVDKS